MDTKQLDEALRFSRAYGMGVTKFGEVIKSMKPTPALQAEIDEKNARAKVSCPTCKATPGMWCRKVPDSTDTVAYHGRRWGQRRRVRCHEARHDKRILCEGLS